MTDTVLVGGIEYDVTIVRGLVDENGKGLDGHVRHAEQNIALRDGMGLGYRHSTLLHEILHSILTQTGHHEAATEDLLDAIAFGLMTVRLDGVPLLNL